MFEPVYVSLDGIEQSDPPGHFCIICVDLKSVAQIFTLRQWLKARPPGCRLIVMTEKGSRLQEAQAFALGATNVVHRVDDIAAVLVKPMHQFASLARAISDLHSDADRGVTAALGALTDAFAVALIGGPLDRAVIDKAGDAIIEQIGGDGLLSWIDTVRRHHSQTSQHSLLVTGLATGFAYKSALPFHAAYQVFVNMGSRLDQDPVREFGGLSRSVLKAA